MLGNNKKPTQTIGIGEMVLSKDNADVLATYSLGSCAGISIYDPVTGIGGLIHCQLPTAKKDPERGKTQPARFTDTGVSALLQAVFNMGAKRERIIAKVAGCGSAASEDDMFKIGKRNYAILRKVLWKNDILISAEDIGGQKPRTMFLLMENGMTLLKSKGEEWTL